MMMMMIMMSSKEWAAERLREKASRDAQYNFLLRQSEKEFRCYTLVYTKPSHREVVHLQIKQLPDSGGQYQLMVNDVNMPAMASVQELISHYRRNNSDDAITLLNCVAPANPGMYLYVNMPAMASVQELINHYRRNNSDDAITLLNCVAPANPRMYRQIGTADYR